HHRGSLRGRLRPRLQREVPQPARHRRLRNLMTAAPRYVLGIAAGGTKTLGLLASESGNVVAEARGGGCHLQTRGELEVEKIVSGIIDNLGGLHPISALCLGLGGVERPQDEVAVRNILRRLGYRETSKVVSLAMVALVAGAPERVGIVLVAGTG